MKKEKEKKKKKKKKERKKNRKKKNIDKVTILSQLSDVFSKQKSTTVKLQKESKMTYHVPL